ncbi:MAG: type II toxin-antitoxin system HicB family antitoxin [Clostridiales bacterium]|nr:type II toxin-antitoxin system HicB family antitoxin [Candidatus Crickella equi]
MKYPYFTYQLETADGYVWAAESLVLNGCVAQGQNVEVAVRELETNEATWLDAAKEHGVAIPDNRVQKYSGKISLRIQPSEHRKAAVKAKLEGISLNQYLCDAIIKRNAE